MFTTDPTIPQPQAQVPSQPTQTQSEFDELNRLISQIQATEMPAELKEKSISMVMRLNKLLQYGSFSKEFEPIEKYVSWLVKIPWGKYTADNLDINNVHTSLDKTHFGLTDVKERILEYVAMLNLLRQNEQAAQNAAANGGVATTDAPTGASEMSRLQGSSSHAPIICFVGVQGIGKTSIAKSIGNAMGKQFIRISLGGLASVTELRGVSRGNFDAGPGQIIKALIRTGVMNPLILLDEIDKVSDQGGTRADVMAALLEILDPEQNSTFNDHYLDYPIDLSRVMFITTANNLGGISAALLDRLEIIRMSSYTDEEKQHIAKDYLLPKVLRATGVDPQQLQFDDDVWELVIRPLGFDAGIRQLERNLTTLARKIAKMIVTGQGTSYRLTKENFREFIPMDFGVYS
jgi:ATP-dependent Lon protease